MRAFIAVDLPGRIRESLQQLQGRLKPELGGLRWVRPIGIHLTLKFLGDIDGADVTSLSQALARDIPGSVEPFDLTVGGIGRFPQRGQPRVLWVGLAEADVVSDRCERLE
ncbi:MAG: RNA 2',3'-cyclic phosphodiesterase [Acidobacteriota bacterium]